MHDFTVETVATNLNLSDRASCCLSLPFCPRFQVKIACMFKQLVDLLLQTYNFTLNQRGNLYSLSLKDLIDDRVHIVSTDLVETVLCKILDELHDLDAVSICLDPYSELGMFCLDLIDEGEKHVVHLIANVMEVWRSEVGIIIDVGLYLRPPDFAASLMEETALLFVGITALAH